MKNARKENEPSSLVIGLGKKNSGVFLRFPTIPTCLRWVGGARPPIARLLYYWLHARRLCRRARFHSIYNWDRKCARQIFAVYEFSFQQQVNNVRNSNESGALFAMRGRRMAIGGDWKTREPRTRRGPLLLHHHPPASIVFHSRPADHFHHSEARARSSQLARGFPNPIRRSGVRSTILSKPNVPAAATQSKNHEEWRSTKEILMKNDRRLKSLENFRAWKAQE